MDPSGRGTAGPRAGVTATARPAPTAPTPSSGLNGIRTAAARRPGARDRSGTADPRGRAGLAGYVALMLLGAATFSHWANVSNGFIALSVAVTLITVSTVHRTLSYVAPYLLYMLIFAFAVHSMPTTGPGLFTWLNGDGRMLVSVLPLLLLGM